MSEEATNDPVQGQRFLWEQPELLNVEDHGHLGMVASPRALSFAETVRAVPLARTEFASAQANFPIVFHASADSMPLAAFAVDEDRNLFMEDGRWQVGAYMPAYIRAHPIALARASNDAQAVIIDRASPAIGENSENPFFSDGELTPETMKHVEFSQALDAEFAATGDFVKKLHELDLLRPQQLEVEGEQVAGYYAVSRDRLIALEAPVVDELFRNGYLAAITAHLFSLERWPDLIRRQRAATTP